MATSRVCSAVATAPVTRAVETIATAPRGALGQTAIGFHLPTAALISRTTVARTSCVVGAPGEVASVALRAELSPAAVARVSGIATSGISISIRNAEPVAWIVHPGGPGSVTISIAPSVESVAAARTVESELAEKQVVQE